MFTRKPEPQGHTPAASTDANSTALKPPLLQPAPMQGHATAQPAQAPATTQTARTTKMSPTVIGADFKITGHAVSDGSVQVDGEIEGDIECSVLTVGETAKIIGNVIAEDVTVQGKVMGSIRGSRVTLEATSHMEGDVYHTQLAIEQGAFFEGKSRRSENPVADAPKSSERNSNVGLSGSTPAPSNGLTAAADGNGKPGNGSSIDSLLGS